MNLESQGPTPSSEWKKLTLNGVSVATDADSLEDEKLIEKDEDEDKLKFSAVDESEKSVSVKPSGPIPMGAVGRTLVFPRQDTVFKSKESLPFDEANSLVWIDRPFQKRREQTKAWLAHFLVGISVGTVAFLMQIMEEIINEKVIEHTQALISNKDTNIWFSAMMFYGVMAAIFATIASIMTTYWGPGASGSGVAELIGYMNGVNYPDFIGIKTLITKTIGVTLAVTGKLCVGKEGPLAHIGANIGIMVLYIPGLGFEYLRNDERKR